MSWMADLGARLVDNGYPVLPIMPGTKKPGLFRAGAWRDYPGWTKHGTRPTSEHELIVWSGWPEAGIGIPTGTVMRRRVVESGDAHVGQIWPHTPSFEACSRASTIESAVLDCGACRPGSLFWPDRGRIGRAIVVWQQPRSHFGVLCCV